MHNPWGLNAREWKQARRFAALFEHVELGKLAAESSGRMSKVIACAIYLRQRADRKAEATG